MATINAVGIDLLGSTGTGAFVGATSATLVTPKIAQINDANNNAIFSLNPTASAVNYIQIVNAATGNAPALSATGTDASIRFALQAKGPTGGIALLTEATGGSAALNVYSGTSSQHQTNMRFPTTAVTQVVTWPDQTGTVLLSGNAINTVPSISFSPTTQGIVGTTAGDNASAGYVGEYTEATNIAGTSMNVATPTNIVSLSLSAGDWDVNGYGNVTIAAGATAAIISFDINTTSATFSSYLTINSVSSTIYVAGNQFGGQTRTLRVSSATTTTVYLIAQVSGGTGTPNGTGYGFISARRIR